MSRAEPRSPALSVIVPVRDGAGFLARSLPALLASDLPRESWELIVVDDGSADESPDVAERYADRVVRLPRPGLGPPAARNRGAGVARAPVLGFVDADVLVHPDALRRMLDGVRPAGGVGAVFGAYDLTPAAPGLVSQFRNLLHSYVHRRDAGPAVTFWTGLGAVRRDVFERVGGFDERERLDDVELGYRMSDAGYRIVLEPEITGCHLKRWTLLSMITTDILYRGVPWARLLLRGRCSPGGGSLNLRRREMIMTALTGAALLLAGYGLVAGDGRPLLTSALAATAALLLDWRLLLWLVGQRGWVFALRAAPLRLLYFVVNVVSVGLAVLPLDWRRPHPARMAEATIMAGEPEQSNLRRAAAEPARPT